MKTGDRQDELAIEVRRLGKVFSVREHPKGLRGALRQLFSPVTRPVMAVHELSFSIRKGERVAFIGPNGAGKSTTIKILTGILRPTSGEGHVLGYVPWQDRTRLGFHIGTVFGQRSQLWYHLPAGDTFDLLASIYELEDSLYRRRRGELVDAFGLAPLLSRAVRQLSLGERMRCEIAASLLHQPTVLFLDEPTIGLDVIAKATLRDLIEQWSERDGMTVLLTSHDPGDMEQVCDRVIVIHHGRLLVDRPVRELRGSFLRQKLVTLLTEEPAMTIGLPGVTMVESSPYRTVLRVDTQVVPVDAVVQAAMKESKLKDLTVENPPMEDIVKAIYESADAP